MVRQVILVSMTSFISALIFSHEASAVTVHRISRVYHDMSEVRPIFMVPRMGTVITLPCSVQDMARGSDDFQVKKSPVDPKRVFLKLTSGHSETTNLTLFCDHNQSVTFDIIANTEVNQDQVIVQGLYGSPEFEETRVIATERLDSQANSSHSMKPKSKILFQLPVVDGAVKASSHKIIQEKTSHANPS